MNVPDGATGADVFPHDEYHFYVTDHNRDPIHIHLPAEIVEDARALIDTDFPTEQSCISTFKFRIDAPIWFKFNPQDPSYSEFIYSEFRVDTNHRLFGAYYEDEVYFDGGFLCDSTGPPADKEQHHYKEIREEVVLPEHRDQYMDELLEWEETGGWDTDWIEPYDP